MSIISINTKTISELDEITELDGTGQNLIVRDANGTKKMDACNFYVQTKKIWTGDIVAERNSHPRCNDISTYSVDDLQAMVSAGTFDDIFLGDIITMSFTHATYGQEEADFMVGAFDPFYNCGSDSYTVLTDHHILLFPVDCFLNTEQMNSSATTEGGYTGSAMYTDVLPAYATAISAAFGGHVLTHSRYLTTGISSTAYSMAGQGLTGSTNAASWSDETLCLMSEVMVYGCHPNSSSRLDVGDACFQLPIFKFRPDLRVAHLGKGSSSRCSWWLSAVTSSAAFACAGSDGNAYYGSASYSYGVRPYFLFG